MQVYIFNQATKFVQHLIKLKDAAIMKYDEHKMNEKVSIVELKTNCSIKELDLNFLFDYIIFPKEIMISKGQWELENRKMAAGDTIVQQVNFPPFANFSLKVIFGVRIKEIFIEENKRGFSYETLDGHAEKGLATFTVEKLNDKLVFIIKTNSTTGNLFSKLVAPIFTFPYQTYCTNKALENVKLRIGMS